MGNTSSSNVEPIIFVIDELFGKSPRAKQDRDEMFQWLVDTFGRGSWTKEDFELYNSRWGWEGQLQYRTVIFFKNFEDATLFKLVWCV